MLSETNSFLSLFLSLSLFLCLSPSLISIYLSIYLSIYIYVYICIYIYIQYIYIIIYICKHIYNICNSETGCSILLSKQTIMEWKTTSKRILNGIFILTMYNCKVWYCSCRMQHFANFSKMESSSKCKKKAFINSLLRESLRLR